ncbi:MAG: 6-phosphogluconolactonase [Chlamydiota bacterium]
MLVDTRRELTIPGDYETTLKFCADHFLNTAEHAIQDHGAFFVALSGGSTPKALFERLTAPPYDTKINWQKVHLFWSDERSVPPNNKESNYHMAMQAGLSKMPIPQHQIHRMCAESDIEKNAELYEKTIRDVLKNQSFDMIMLGMGEDGHTASLFPGTKGLEETKKFVVANFIPQKNTWRMSLSFPCINAAKLTVFYILGASKKEMLAKVLKAGDELPAQHVGTKEHPALFIADKAAAQG